MGLTATDLNLLFDLRDRGHRPARIATIGRLSLYLHPKQVQHLSKIFPDSPAIASYCWGGPCEEILKVVTGATEVVSIDASDYEGATIVHDMNLPLRTGRPDLVGRFDLVIDGGSLEHVFNFPVAVENLMALCRVGGCVISANPANNLCGHGFYQFTPELMHRLYSEQNGFSSEYVLLTICNSLSVERDRQPRTFQVVDPSSLGRRVLINNCKPVMIRILARKIDDCPLDPTEVQQSDYTAAWSGNHSTQVPVSNARRALKTFFALLPHMAQTLVLNRLSKSPLRDGKEMKRWQGPLD